MKIVIIGGGPAGSTAARALAPYHDVTIVQNRPDFDKPCGGGVKTKIFDEFSIPKSLIKHSLDHVYMIYKNDKIKIDLNGENLSIVKRAEFDEKLRNLAVQAGAKILYGRFKTFQNKKAVIKTREKDILLEYDILIAADGVNSTVRKAVNISQIPSTITHYARTDGYKVKTCEFFFDFNIGGEYYAWAFPHENLTHLGTVSRKNFENLCHYLNLSLKPKGYKIPTWERDIIIQKENIYFVGDAAGQVMPLSFEGIYYAIKSADLLANCILENKNYPNEWNKRFFKEFSLMKKLEALNKTFIRGFVVKAHKLKLIQNFSVKMWLGE
ncbi:geranylgeranyl reductase [Nautilia sp. PV-1]|uniref:FAD-dependent monooxygenase n=1 Tax=Nautilia sp. PV-1 TaxID=2579250 RepID=UPI000FD8C73B|nr:NAD(P)/FAD-dependent oxidoreductase [Nautilia sp. PV-1]AZV47253.1 geranylgeranyl reductase [Nautilia sp. PV-1]